MCFDYRIAKGVYSSEMWDGIGASMPQVVLNIVVCECYSIHVPSGPNVYYKGKLLYFPVRGY